MKIIYTRWHWVAGLTAIFVYLADILSNLERSYEIAQKLVDSNNLICLAIGVGALVSAGCIGQGQSKIVYSVLLFLCWIVCATWSITMTMERMSIQKDRKVVVFDASKRAVLLAESELETKTERRNRACDSVPTRKRRERKEDFASRIQIIKGNCEHWTKEVAKERTTLKFLKAQVPAESKTDDPLGRRLQRLAKLVGFEINGTDVTDLVVPLLGPLALQLLSSVLMAWATAGVRVKPEFNVALTGRAAESAKVQRFATAFFECNGRKPTAKEIEAAIGISYQKALKYTKTI